jgi:hypothetical protein
LHSILLNNRVLVRGLGDKTTKFEKTAFRKTLQICKIFPGRVLEVECLHGVGYE